MTNKEYTDEAVRLLKLLISTPSAEAKTRLPT